MAPVPSGSGWVGVKGGISHRLVCLQWGHGNVAGRDLIGGHSLRLDDRTTALRHAASDISGMGALTYLGHTA